MKRDYYRLVFFYLSIFVMMIGFIQLLPLLVLPFYPEEINYASCFIIPGIVSIVAGLLLHQLFRNTRIMKLEKMDDFFAARVGG